MRIGRGGAVNSNDMNGGLFMCGIIGYTGRLDARPVIINGLLALEYRGYDSAGISFFADDNSGIMTIKTTGKVNNLAEKLKSSDIKGTPVCGIGHTRWATHGGVSEINSHPHTFGNVTLIHNGIIENYHSLANMLSEYGKFPVSQTDTEIAAMVIDYYYTGDACDAINKACGILEGSYAFCIMFADQPGVIYSIRKNSPLIGAICESGAFVASDVVAIIDYTKDYFILPENHIAKLTQNSFKIYNLCGEEIIPEVMHVNWDIAAAKKGGYEHFMLKEIHEQPDALTNTISPRIINGLPDFSDDNIPDELFKNIKRIVITACGTAMHAGMFGRIMIEKYSRIPVSVEIASEFRYSNPILADDTLVIAISQSGETADTLAAVRLAKSCGAKTLSVVNVKGSIIANESDYVLYTHAGPEISVASTKAYVVQLSLMYLIAYRIAIVNGMLSDEAAANKVKGLFTAIDNMKKVLNMDEELYLITNKLSKAEDIFYLGRGLDYAIACEGSLKLKEISYIHAEAYAAGELKHGTISLITDNVPVIAFATQEHIYQKVISNVVEVRSRGAYVILVTSAGKHVDTTLCDHHIILPRMDEEFTPFCTAVILQYLAYYTAVRRNLNVDQPRNLAKSVTVE